MPQVPYRPSEEEIYRLCKQFQEDWTMAEERSRRGDKSQYIVPSLQSIRQGRMTIFEPTDEPLI